MTRALPEAHPLRRTFETYRDARNDAGVVDAFLHAGDRGFTGRGLGRLLHDAGLRAASFEHRPWGQPHLQAARLGLDPERPFEILHDLDLWQEMRTNLIVSCVHQQAPARPIAPAPSVIRPHPAFTYGGRSMRGRVELLYERALGTVLPSRTHGDPVRLAGRALREAARLSQSPGIDPATVETLREAGLLLGATRPVDDRLGPRSVRLSDDAPPLPDWDDLATGRPDGPIANPLHGALFAAWGEALSTRTDGESLRERIDRRANPVAPLEDARCPFGLTPEGSIDAIDEDMVAQVLRTSASAAGRDPVRRVTGFRVRGRNPARELAPVLDAVPGLPDVRDLPERALLDCWAALVAWREPTLEVEATEVDHATAPPDSSGPTGPRTRGQSAHGQGIGIPG